jgi:DNA-binding NarL/FixJ family response regulator
MKLKLLLADHHEIFREGLKILLKNNEDIEIVSACSTGDEALRSVMKNQVDVVLMDIGLPNCNGIDAIKQIRENRPELGIIVLTHSEDDHDLYAAIRAGANAYVIKRITMRNLVKIITLVAEGDIIISPPMGMKLVREFNLLEEGKDSAKLASLLSKREESVLSLVANNLSTQEIANELSISKHTVSVHLRNIMEKLHTHSRQQAVALVGKNKLIQA